jgi:hypothetical protein
MTDLDRIPLALELPQRDVKEMLSVRTLPDGRRELRMNHSSYSLMSLCKRKAHYSLNKRLTSRSESPATLFGSAIHSALEVWYTADPANRRRGNAACDDSFALMESGQAPVPHGRCVRCASAYAFLKRAQGLQALPSDDKRSLRNGLTILEAYFDTYADDPFVVLTDALGPLCERMLSFTVSEDRWLRVTFFGTLDAVLRNSQSGQVILCDHKTTSALGKDFLQRINPNWQYVSYVAAFRANYPEYDTRTFMSNGVLVAKTKTSFARQFCQVGDSLIADWKESFLDSAHDWLKRMDETRSFPMMTPDPCTQWGGCQYRTICETPSQLRDGVIRASYDASVDDAEGGVVV